MVFVDGKIGILVERIVMDVEMQNTGPRSGQGFGGFAFTRRDQILRVSQAKLVGSVWLTRGPFLLEGAVAERRGCLQIAMALCSEST